MTDNSILQKELYPSHTYIGAKFSNLLPEEVKSSQDEEDQAERLAAGSSIIMWSNTWTGLTIYVKQAGKVQVQDRLGARDVHH